MVLLLHKQILATTRVAKPEWTPQVVYYKQDLVYRTKTQVFMQHGFCIKPADTEQDLNFLVANWSCMEPRN